MTKDSDAISAFREAYFEYLDGERAAPPSTEALTDSARRAVERWLRSLDEARGMDPYASRPSASELLARVDAQGEAKSDGAIQRALEDGLRSAVDARAFVSADVASTAAGLASSDVIHARGLRIRVVVEPRGADLAAAFRSRLGDVAGVFGAFPDTSAVLITTSGSEPKGTVIDRYDVVSAIETPSGRTGTPRLPRAITDAVAACADFVNLAMPRFESFRYVPTVVPGHGSPVIDVDRISAEAIHGVVQSGERARLEAKRKAWSELGETERVAVSRLLGDTLHRPVSEEEYRQRIEKAVKAA